jgi:two-component SAPR family response regulator
VDEFINSSQALEHFLEYPNDYCMLVSDIRMPSPTGFELAKEIYKINPDVKILLMSSFEIHKSELIKSCLLLELKILYKSQSRELN